MEGAKAAVTSCLVLAFSAISWASVHEAVESSHLLPRASDDDAANEAGTEA
jgi:predicted dinucleotide-binding enzyme